MIKTYESVCFNIATSRACVCSTRNFKYQVLAQKLFGYGLGVTYKKAMKRLKKQALKTSFKNGRKLFFLTQPRAECINFTLCSQLKDFLYD